MTEYIGFFCNHGLGGSRGGARDFNMYLRARRDMYDLLVDLEKIKKSPFDDLTQAVALSFGVEPGYFSFPSQLLESRIAIASSRNPDQVLEKFHILQRRGEIPKAIDAYNYEDLLTENDNDFAKTQAAIYWMATGERLP